MITKTQDIDQIMITESNAVHLRDVTRIMENGVQISETYHRRVLWPGDDLSEQSPRVQKICAAVWV